MAPSQRRIKRGDYHKWWGKEGFENEVHETYLKVMFHHSPTESEENQEKSLSEQPEIQNGYLNKLNEVIYRLL
jgi:hypothetical protein